MCKLSPRYLMRFFFLCSLKTRAENHLALLIILHVSHGMLQVHMRNEIGGNLLSQRRTNSMAIKTDNFCVAFLFLSPQLYITLQLLDCECDSMTINIQYLLKLLPTSHSMNIVFLFVSSLRNYRPIMITFFHCYVHRG